MKRTAFITSIQLVAVALLMTCGLSASAQKAWSTSKAVNEVSNKSLFADEELASTHIEANASAQPAPTSMKGVSRVSTKTKGQQIGNIRSEGTPAWVNSKGVSNVGTVRPRKSKHVPAIEPLIPADQKDTSKG